MSHSGWRMKKVTLILTVALMAALASAEGDSTRKRSMSLTDCVQEALLRNLDVQIERINPQVSREELRGSYAGYDPTFRVAGEHRYQLSGGGFDPSIQFNIPPTEGEFDTLSAGLSGGLLPWGTTYDIAASVTESVSTFTTNRSDTSRGSVGITLSQPLLKNFLIDGTRLRISVSKNRLNYSEMGLRVRIMDVVTRVEKAYYDLIAARENVKVQEKALQLAEQRAPARIIAGVIGAQVGGPAGRRRAGHQRVVAAGDPGHHAAVQALWQQTAGGYAGQRGIAHVVLDQHAVCSLGRAVALQHALDRGANAARLARVQIEQRVECAGAAGIFVQSVTAHRPARRRAELSRRLREQFGGTLAPVSRVEAGKGWHAHALVLQPLERVGLVCPGQGRGRSRRCRFHRIVHGHRVPFAARRILPQPLECAERLTVPGWPGSTRETGRFRGESPQIPA